ncbi:hypothetical protein AB3S75_002498 [Citrus x aurantiifolia]
MVNSHINVHTRCLRVLDNRTILIANHWNMMRVTKEKLQHTWERDLHDESVCILTKPPSMSLFGRQLKKSHQLSSPYTIPPLKIQKSHNIENLLATEVIHVDDGVRVDIDPLKGLDNLILFSEFEQWFRGEITVSQPIAFTKDFFEIILLDNKSGPHGWLGDEVSSQVIMTSSHANKLEERALVVGSSESR